MASESTEKDSLVTIQELIKLPDIGVNKKFCTWSRVTMVSDSHICARHKSATTDNNPGQEQILVLRLSNDDKSSSPITLPIKADSAVVCPPDGTDKEQIFYLAYQQGDHLKVMTLEDDPQEVASCHVTGIRYWTWITCQVIAIVTQTDILHWYFPEDEDPALSLCEADGMADTEIVSYRSDPQQNWLALTGLVSEPNVVAGVTQLYCCQKDISQTITGHTTLFTSLCLDPSGTVCPVFCTACRDIETKNIGKVHVIPLGPDLSESTPMASTCLITFDENSSKYDFPVILEAVPATGLLYVLTKYGMLYLCDMITAECLCKTQVSQDVIFAATLNRTTNGLLIINRDGQVLQLEIKATALEQYVQKTLKKPDVAKRVSLLIQSPSSDTQPMDEEIGLTERQSSSSNRQQTDKRPAEPDSPIGELGIKAPDKQSEPDVKEPDKLELGVRATSPPRSDQTDEQPSTTASSPGSS